MDSRESLGAVHLVGNKGNAVRGNMFVRLCLDTVMADLWPGCCRGLFVWLRALKGSQHWAGRSVVVGMHSIGSFRTRKWGEIHFKIASNVKDLWVVYYKGCM